MQAQATTSSLASVLLCGLAACAAPQPQNSVAAAPARESDAACGLRLPCTPHRVHSHDLYSAMAAAAERQRRQLFAEQRPRPGCIQCTEPARFFAEQLRQPSAQTLFHVYLSLSELAQQDLGDRPPDRPGAAWAWLHRRAQAQLAKARTEGGEVACSLLSASCASTPAFISGFVPFAEELLARDGSTRAVAEAKEAVVKIALHLDPPGAIPMICRYIRGGARERARMKAVRDLCGYAGREPLARQTLEWVIAEDPDLQERARRCLEGPGSASAPEAPSQPAQ